MVIPKAETCSQQ